LNQLQIHRIPPHQLLPLELQLCTLVQDFLYLTEASVELLPTGDFSDITTEALAHPMNKSNLFVLRDGEDQEGGKSEA
jgi:hypothetical protein